MVFVFLEFIQCRRAGAHQGHVAFEHVEELGKFIQGIFADEFADAGDLLAVLVDAVADDPGIKFHLEHHAVLNPVLAHEFCLALFRVQIHAAEFINFELFSIFADPHLGKKYRAGGLSLNGRCHKKIDDAGEDAAHDTAEDVQHPFFEALAARHIVQGGGDDSDVAHVSHQLF